MAATPTPEALKASALLRDAWDLVKRHPMQLALPLVILGLLTSGGNGGGGRRIMDASPQLPWYAIIAAIVAGVVLIVLALVILALLLVATAALLLTTTRSAFAAARGEPLPTFGEAFSETRPRLVPAAVALLLGGLLVALGFVLLVVPGVILLGILLPLFAILHRERRTSTQGISRSWELARGHVLDLSLVAGAGVLAILVASVLLSWIPIVGGALNGAVVGLVQAVWVVAGVLFYERRLAGAPAPDAPARI